MANELMIPGATTDIVSRAHPVDEKGGTSQQQRRDEARNFFSRMWDDAFSREQDTMLRLWGAARSEWLEAVTYKSNSAHTVRSYVRGLDAWWGFIKAEPWLVSDKRRAEYEARLQAEGITRYTLPWEASGNQVAAWIQEMRARELGPATINQCVAAASSFYSFVARKTQMLNGVEYSLFCDADGHPRQNPFRHANVRRPQVQQYEKSHPLTVDQVQRLRRAVNGPATATPEEYARLMTPCKGRALVNARDHALLAVLLFTGRRSAEVAKLRWGDIEPGTEPGTYLFKWSGKGGKSDIQVLPAEAYWYVVGWLKAAGRWEPGPGQFIFSPITADAAKHFERCKDLAPAEHIGTGQIGKIIRKLAKRADLPLELVHTHTMRHTFAWHHYQAKGDLKALQKLLGHSNVATTGIYLSSPGFNKPVDDFGHLLQHSFKF